MYFVDECIHATHGRILAVPYEYCEAYYLVSSSKILTCAPAAVNATSCQCENISDFPCSVPI